VLHGTGEGSENMALGEFNIAPSSNFDNDVFKVAEFHLSVTDLLANNFVDLKPNKTVKDRLLNLELFLNCYSCQSLVHNTQFLKSIESSNIRRNIIKPSSSQ
jgi:hypothetical protein